MCFGGGYLRKKCVLRIYNFVETQKGFVLLILFCFSTWMVSVERAITIQNYDTFDFAVNILTIVSNLGFIFGRRNVQPR